MRRRLLGTSTAVIATAVAGTIGTDVDSAWYRRLAKPSWQPPGAAFGPVWTVLYVLLAGAGARGLARAGESDAAGGTERERAYARAYGLNLVLNAGWTWTFFRARRPDLAAVEAVLLQLSTVDLTRRTWQFDRAAGVALLPYAGWVSFAAALTTDLARRNPRVTGEGQPPLP